MGKISLCDLYLTGDVPVYEVNTDKEFKELWEHWIFPLLKYEQQRVWVCFQYYEEGSIESVQDILTTQSILMVRAFGNEVVCSVGVEKLRFSVHQFNTWKEALEYCMELKEESSLNR